MPKDKVETSTEYIEGVRCTVSKITAPSGDVSREIMIHVVRTVNKPGEWMKIYHMVKHRYAHVQTEWSDPVEDGNDEQKSA